MSFEFQSTLVNVTPSYRIGGSQIGGVRMEKVGPIDTIRLIITNDADIRFAASGPFENGDPAAIYAALAADLYEIAPGVLVNEGAIGSIEIKSDEIVIDLEGSDRKFKLSPDSEILEATEVADHNWKLTTASFAALTAAAGIWRSSLDGTLEGLSTSITTEVADRITAITAEKERVDALIASGMWLYPDQESFPPAADNHGRVVHSHADGATFYAHGGMWHQLSKEVDLQTAIASIDSEATAREAADTALSGRLDVLEADPTTATAVVAGDAATLSSATTYTDTAISNVIGSAPGVLDTLGEIADAINDDANVYTTLVSQVNAVQTDVDANEIASDAADAALSGRLDTLEVDPTTAAAVQAVQDNLDTEAGTRAAADSSLDGRLDTLEADPTTATAVAAVQSDVDANQTSSEAADTALSGRLDVLEADPTTATAVAAVQADVDANETASDAAEAALSGRLDTLEADPTTATALAAGDAATLSSANTYTDTSITNLVNGADAALDTLKEIGDALAEGDSDVNAALTAQITTEATTRANADTGLSDRLDTLEADPTTATAVAAVQSDVDQNETDSDAADAALSGRLDVLEADPTTATAVAAVQADVDQNEADGDAADAALSGRIDTLEADPTTATAVAAVQSDVDQNEADADAALALKAPLADPDFTGQLEVDTNARIEFADNLTKVHNVLRGTSIEVGNNIQLNPASADGRVEIEGGLYLRPSDMVDAANDTDAAAAGVIVGGVYRNGSVLNIRVS